MCTTILSLQSLIAVVMATASAQTTTPQEPIGNSVTIENANQSEQVVPATGTKRQSLTIKNNNTNNDSCWVYIGSDKASKENSIALAPGGSYVRY